MFGSIKEDDTISWMKETSRTESGCTTKLKSRIEIIGADGEEIKPLIQRGNYIWDFVPPNSTLKYEIEIKAQESGSQSDRVNLSVIGLNIPYLIDIRDRILSQSTPQQIEEYKENPSKLTELVYDRMDSERIMIKALSKEITTNPDGFAIGEIPLSSSIRGPIAIEISYGYSKTSEAVGWSRFWKTTAPSVVYTLLEVALIVIGFVPGMQWTWGARAGLLSAEAAQIMMEIAHEGEKAKRGTIGDNKYGCSLGNGHFHVYGGVVTTLKPDSQRMLTERLGYGIAAIGLAVVVIMMLPKFIGDETDDS